MKHRLLPLLLAIFPLAALAAPVCVDPEQPKSSHLARSGIGGTGNKPDTQPQSPGAKKENGGGIGGTGAPKLGSTGGIGGTGAPEIGGIGGTGGPAIGDGTGGIGGTGGPMADGARIGIVGVISGFASVCVNGVEVHFPPGVTVVENGEASSADKLAVGNVVSIDATNSPKGLEAKNIAVINALEGPVTHLPKGGKAIMVLGQAVAITPDTRMPGKALAVGQLVKVSALPGADGQLFATRIQPSPNLKQAGALGQISTSGKLSRINGIPVDTRIQSSTALVKGKWSGTELVATSITADPTYRFADKVSRILVEGLVQTSDGHGRIKTAGLELALPNNMTSQAKSLHPNQRIFVDLQTGKTGELLVKGLEITNPKDHHAPKLERHTQEITKAEAEGLSEAIEKAEAANITEKSERAEKSEKSERTERAERSEKSERAEKSERVEKSERTERSEKPERVEKVEKVEKAEKAEKVEKVEKVEHH